MRRNKRRGKSIVSSSHSSLTLVSSIIKAIIVISIGLGFVGISFKITSLQIILLLVVDILISAVFTRKQYTLELVCIVFSLLLFISPLNSIGLLVIFVLLIYSILRDMKILR